MLRDLGYSPNNIGPSPVTNVAPVVFVVDDDISIRESLELLIRSAGWRPEIFGSPIEFLAQPRMAIPHCLVLDVNLPELNGLALQQLIAAERTETPIIFVTGYGDVPTSVMAMKAGAAEFLTKPFSEDVMLSSIEQALERSRSALSVQSDREVLEKRYASLSPREKEVLSFVISGLMNKQIAFELGISEITVKAHRGQMTRKMQARSLPDLVAMATKLGVNR